MAGLIPPSTLEQVRGASDIVDVIGSYIPLKKAGANFVALCPFHREKSPSFNVNPHRQIFHCFGCHKGGDVFRFVQEYENLSFVEAVRRLADRAKIPLVTDSSARGEKTRQVKDVLREVHERITQRWQKILLQETAGEPARRYLAQRGGIPPETVRAFRLGYAPDSWQDTVDWGRSNGFDENTLEQAGLIVRKENQTYDRFRGRLMFPICDEQGRVIGFSGRVLSADAKAAKYVNSPETPLFSKGRVFFGLDKARRALLDAGYAILCEGQLDLMACHGAGFNHVVAPQGTALTADHARILKRYVEEVVLCFDADSAGQTAAIRSLDPLLAASLAIRVAVIPAPHDPDSFIREAGPAAFGQLIEQAQGFFDFFLDYLCREHDPTTDRGRNRISQEMHQALAMTANAVWIDTYAQKTALRLGVSPEAVRTTFRRTTKVRPPQESSPPQEQALAAPSAPESWLVLLLLAHPDLVPWAQGTLDLGWIQHDALRRAVERLLQRHQEGQWHGIAQFLSETTDPVQSQLISAASTIQQTIETPRHHLKEVLVRLRNLSLDRELRRLKQELAQPDVSLARQEEVLRLLTELRRTKQEPFELRDGACPPP